MNQENGPRDLILAGIPRSGTTLTCFLLNQLPNVVALAEPMQVMDFDPLDHGANRTMISNFFTTQRRRLQFEGRSAGKSADGMAIDNPLSDALDPATGKRALRHNQNFIRIGKPLDPGFTLALKHPGAFSALLPILSKSHECYAVVRNPLAVLMSWQQTPFAVSNGHAPAAERLDPALANLLALEGDLHDRQIALLSWFFERFRGIKQRNVIKYEDIISTDAAVIPERFGIHHPLAWPLETRNDRYLNDPVCHALAERLVNRAGAYMDHYSAEDIFGLVS